MESLINKNERLFKRVCEILPGLLSWVAILSPFILSLKIPAAVAYTVLFMDIYWLYRTLKISAGVLIGYGRVKKAENTNWQLLLKEQFPDEFDKISHLVVIPTYKESLTVIDQTLKALSLSNYPLQKIMIIVGFEAKDDPQRVADLCSTITDKYGPLFGKFFTAVHQLSEGEVWGPASNRTFAIKKFLDENDITPHNVLLTTLDSDFRVHPQFLAGATYRYLTLPEKERDKRSYTGVFWYNNNYWDTIAPMRVNAISTAFWQLSEMVTSSKYQNFASMTINLKSVIDINFWPLNVVNDDSAFYWKAYYYFDGDYKVIPHYLPISADAVQDKTTWLTYKNQYRQYQRWAYGVEHFPFIAKHFLTNKRIPFRDKFDHLFFFMQSSISWAMLGFIVTFGGIVLPLLNPFFKQTVIGYNFPKISSLILTVALIGLLSSVWVESKVTPPRPSSWPLWKKLSSLLQWVLTPALIIVFGTIPALDAQSRLLLGRYLNFNVTIKERKL